MLYFIHSQKDKYGFIKILFFIVFNFSIVKLFSQEIYQTLPSKILERADIVHNIGDFNKDGFSDIILGIGDSDPDEVFDPGLAIIYFGSPSGPIYKSTIFMNEFWPESAITSGDFNSDGFDDFAIGKAVQKNPENSIALGAINIYYGNAEGDISNPFEIVGDRERNSFGQYLTSLGDINNDGFEDLSSSTQTGIYIYYGSSTGLPSIKSLHLTEYYFSFSAGDINNDGYDDFYGYLQAQDLYLFHGSPSGPISQGPKTEILTSAGDLNNDGFGDLVSLSNSTLFFYYGNQNGFDKSDSVISDVATYRKDFDLNNDGYNDLLIRKVNSRNMEIYLGGQNGISPDPSILFVRPIQEDYLLVSFGPTGDLNNDGSPEFYVVYDSTYIYPGIIKSSLICISDTAITLEKDCEVEVLNIDPPGISENYLYKISGAINKEGIGSASGTRLGPGQYLITYSEIIDSTAKCSFVVTIRDTISPAILSKPEGIFCNVIPGQTGIEPIKVIDCSTVLVTYQLNPPYGKSGIGSDVSKDLNYGTNNILWTIVDKAGNSTQTSSSITLLKNNLNVKIPKAYQINAQQSQANTIYLGYANNTLRLTAYEANSAKHTYRWSNGDTTRYTRVRHNVPGKYEYSVIVTNNNECSDTAYTIVTVVDNFCPNPLKDFITQYFPQLLDQPWIQALIASTSQVYLCYNGSTVCVNPAQVPALINNGARLGKCGVIYESNDLITAKEEMNSVGALTLTASPNPSGYEFTLKIDGTKGKPYALRIINSVGSQVFLKQGITENVVRAGATFQKGVYFAEVICGKERKVIKLLKVR